MMWEGIPGTGGSGGIDILVDGWPVWPAWASVRCLATAEHAQA